MKAYSIEKNTNFLFNFFLNFGHILKTCQNENEDNYEKRQSIQQSFLQNFTAFGLHRDHSPALELNSYYLEVKNDIIC